MEHSITPGTKLGPYELVAPLGAGGMGVVYEARDTRLNRHAAIKVLPATAIRDFHRNERFEQEARAASALNHPNILTVFDFGEQDGIHYIATELVVGRTLRRADRSRMDLHEIVRIAAEVANGLAAAHAAGIVHRDIKPENIMVRPDGYIKILDFGLAKLINVKPLGAADSTLTVGMAATQPGAILGTISYMSPEQARGLPVDARRTSGVSPLSCTSLYPAVCRSTEIQAPTLSYRSFTILRRRCVRCATTSRKNSRA